MKGADKMNRLKELRQDKKKTQKQLADEVGVTKRTYIYWEKGERQIKPDKAQKLADYFGVSVGYLLGFGTIEEEIASSRKEAEALFEQENTALLNLGYPLSDHDLNYILQLIHEISSKNTNYFWKMIEHKDPVIKQMFEADFSSFAERYPKYIEDLESSYKDYIRKTTDREEIAKTRQRLKMIEDFQNNK